MKRYLFSFFAGCMLAPLAAQETNDSIEEAFRRGLFAEEVDSDLKEAETAYSEVLKSFYEQKKLAATAAYRLAEVFRKMAVANPSGKHSDRAVQQYERVMREFPEAEALAKLSRENLAAMGKPIPEVGKGSLNAPDKETQIIAQLNEWKETSPDKLTETPTPLYQAAKANQLRVAKHLIAQGVDLNGDLLTPLAAAAGEGHLSMVELLLDAGADPRPEGKTPPIHLAMGKDRMEIFKKLIEVGAHLKLEDHKEDPPLHYLCEIFEQNNNGASIPLQEKRNLEYAEMLIEAGASVDEVDQSSGKTILYKAVETRFQGMVSLLLEKGADVNLATRKTKTTPLIRAIQTSKSHRILEIVKILLAAEAKVDQTDANGFTALHHCLLEGLPLDYVEALIEAGADVTKHVGENGWTPLHFWARSRNDDRIGRALYRAGGNPIALADSFPYIKDRIPKVAKNTPLDILHETCPETEAIVREFYEHGIQSLSPEKFAAAVWFAMPTEPREVSEEVAKLSPTDLIANIFPAFEEGEIKWAEEKTGPTVLNQSPPGLAEFIVRVYSYGPSSKNRKRPKTPNLEKLRILRSDPSPDGEPRWKVVTVSFKDLAEAAEKGADIPLQWGDVVLFDQLNSNRPSNWSELKSYDAFGKDEGEIGAGLLQKAASLNFTLTLGEISSSITIAPRPYGQTVDVAGDTGYPEMYQIPSSLHNLKQYIRYRDDLDLNQAKVLRTIGDHTNTIAIPLEDFAEDAEFYLKDGDHVIIPRKQNVEEPSMKDRDSSIWISNPQTHVLKIVTYRSKFRNRPVTGIKLSRAIAQYYADTNNLPLIPFPDFQKVRLMMPGNSTPETIQFFPTENDEAETLIPWGTIIELPIEEGKKPSDWIGLSREQQKFLRDSTKLTITIQPEGQEPKPMTAEFSFPGYKRSASGELVEEYRSQTRLPNFWDLLGSEFQGEDVKWDKNRFILEAGGKVFNYTSGSTVSDFLDGDVLKIFRKL